MSPSDTQLPQITGSPRDTVEVTTPVPTEARTAAQSPPTPAVSPDIQTQFQLIQGAFKEERELRVRQATLAAQQLEGMRHELKAVVEVAENRRSRSNFFAHVLAPVA